MPSFNAAKAGRFKKIGLNAIQAAFVRLAGKNSTIK